ncbi:Uncharacterised protein [Vibrio cholerae]|nr:Uncharacterised protein [Vibrio cholerae]CSB86389.1 Uncharacterised protein [Vibrio cholerae]CSC41942.1 Uncharacterised protein [Vibrio cholerae]CSC72041.1 Uncharacterised protein [Vibrio cholerae]CSC82613.1 Uncharacterised protein [Vibrio cholerae]
MNIGRGFDFTPPTLQQITHPNQNIWLVIDTQHTQMLQL